MEAQDLKNYAMSKEHGTKFNINGKSAMTLNKDGKLIVQKQFDVAKGSGKPKAPHLPTAPGTPKSPADDTQSGQIQVTPMNFIDVKSSDWFYPYVKYVYERGIMRGVGENKFAPQSHVSRAMIVTMLYRIAKEPDVSLGSNYSDNTQNTWYSDAVKWTAQKGLAKDFTKDKFEPDKNLTREQMVSLLYHYQKAIGKQTVGVSDLNGFKDAKLVSDYAETPMKWAIKAGIIQGDDKKQLNPQANITRAEVAAVIQRFHEIK